MTNGYTSVTIPKMITEKVQRLIDDGAIPYRSVSEFLTDLGRRKLEEIEARMPVQPVQRSR